MTSALLLVAFLVVVEFSYRRWIRRLGSRRGPVALDVAERDRAEHATVVPLPNRASPPQRPARRSG